MDNNEYMVDMNSVYGVSGISIAGDPNWADYTYEVDLRGDQGVDKLILARYTDNSNYYNIDIRAGFDDVYLQKDINGTETTLNYVHFVNSNDSWYHIKLNLLGSRLLLYVNDSLLIDYTDSTSPLTHGKIGFRGWNGAKVRYDNVLVTVEHVLPTSVAISGPGIVSINALQSFAATVGPISVSQPITYVWQASGQTPITHTFASLSDTATFLWNVQGVQAITATVTNRYGAASSTFTLTTALIAPDSVTISGQALGGIHLAQSFTARVSPITATTPITYRWDAPGQAPITHSVAGPSDPVAFTWDALGQQAVTVTVQSLGGIVSASRAITIAAFNPAPTISGIQPAYAIAGAPDFTLTVTGTGFINSSVMRWNGSDYPTTFINGSQLMASMAAADLMVGSPAKVTVFNPAPGGGESNSLDFVIGHYVYLPVIMLRWPPVPDIPVLNPINNPDFDGNYNVSWNTAYLANSYILQEDTSASFLAPSTVYNNTGTSWPAGGKAPGTYYYRVMASNAYGGSGWSNVQLVIVKPSLQGINGHVTVNGSAVGGVSLQLRFFNGSSYSTYATTATAGDGTFQFTSAPTLGAGQKLYVRYLNPGDTSRVAGWSTRVLTSYTTGTPAAIGDFDLANILLVSPGSGATVSLPRNFQWSRRTATTSDSYEFDLFEPNTFNPWWWTALLGYADNYTLNTLPSRFNPGVQYAWTVYVYAPDGSYGAAYYMRYVTYSNSGVTLDGNGPAIRAPFPSDPPIEGRHASR